MKIRIALLCSVGAIILIMIASHMKSEQSGSRNVISQFSGVCQDLARLYPGQIEMINSTSEYCMVDTDEYSVVVTKNQVTFGDDVQKFPHQTTEFDELARYLQEKPGSFCVVYDFQNSACVHEGGNYITLYIKD